MKVYPKQSPGCLAANADAVPPPPPLRAKLTVVVVIIGTHIVSW
jgi:hypothetical protein